MSGNKTKKFWVLVWDDGKTIVPIVPEDENPGDDDQGMIVYRTKDAAENAAQHQQDFWSLDVKAKAIPLSELDSEG
jgi:hypothetical protein